MDTRNVLVGKEEMYEKYRKATEQKEGSICYIFGAGASYGYSTEEISYLPPIVTQLFDDKNNIVNEVIRRPEHSFILGHREFLMKALKRYDNDLEKYLSILYDKNDSDDLFSSLLLYLQDVFYTASDRAEEHNNNYKNLINHSFTSRGKLPWSCISFNYDTLLEQSYIFAQRDKARDFENLEGYLVYPKIIKVHGSVNFRYVLQEGADKLRKTDKDVFGLMMNGEKDIGERVEVFHPNTKSSRIPPFHIEKDVYDKDFIRRSVNLYNFPLMMVPIHGSKRSEHEFFLEMLEEAKKEIEKASLVIAIGYNFGDKFFTNEINTLDLSKKELILVGTQKLARNYEDHPAYKNALKVFKTDNIAVFDGEGFTDFVEIYSYKLSKL